MRFSPYFNAERPSYAPPPAPAPTTVSMAQYTVRHAIPPSIPE